MRYINAYGPTETTILSTAWQPSRAPEVHEPIVIGTPISNTRVRVANRFNQALPAGVIGELLIGGEGVTHGYIKRDALTAERFVTLDGMRWYRTSGDLAPASTPTAGSSSPAASTARSSCAATGSSRAARSRRRCSRSTASGRRR